VLLKNDGVLPLKKDVSHILVAGSGADNAGRQMGAWTIEWQGVDGNWVPGVSTIVQGIKEIVSPTTNVEYRASGVFEGDTRAEIGIVVVSEPPYAEGWGDNPLPTLSEEDTTALKNMRSRCDRLVVVTLSGRPLILSGQEKEWDALVSAWLPGSEGSAIAPVLFGEVPFSGVLPMDWPASLTVVSIGTSNVPHRQNAYERGFGLTR
jgi:beta-glucosidase